MAVVAVLVGVGAPRCVEYVRLLAVEDTRTEAARLVRLEWARGGRVAIAANPVLATYVGPDLPLLPRYDPGLPLAAVARIAAAAPRCVAPLPSIDPARDEPALAAHAGTLVVTSDAPAPAFDRASTPPAAIAVLARRATLVADLTVEDHPAVRVYEAFDLNYVPLGGLASLRRPGPRLRLWRLPD